MTAKKRHEDPEATQIVVSRRLEAVDEPRLEDTQEGRSPATEVVEDHLTAQRRRNVVLYSVAVALLSTVGLALLVSYAWYLPPGDSLTALTADLQRYALMNTLLTMLVAGAAGGALSNLREFLRLGRKHDGVPVRLEVPLYLRPLSGAVVGVLVFFMLQFFVAVLSVGGTTQGWAMLHGRLAYVAVALGVGFGVRDLERAREVAASLVARRTESQRDALADSAATKQAPPKDLAGYHPPDTRRRASPKKENCG